MLSLSQHLLLCVAGFSSALALNDVAKRAGVSIARAVAADAELSPETVLPEDVGVPLLVALQRQTPPRWRQVMTNVADMSYTASISVGGQTIQGILDTGSFEFLVFSTLCETCGGTELFYDPGRSESHEEGPLQRMHSFGSGNTYSLLAWDAVELGPFDLERQYFWEVHEAELPVLHHGSFQAIVGVGPPSSARADNDNTIGVGMGVAGSTPLFAQEIMREQRSLLENLDCLVFSVCLRRGPFEEGYFVWNDHDPRTLPNFEEIAVTGSIHWGATMTDVQLTGGAPDAALTIGCANGCGAVLDSGTSLLVVPTAVADRVLSEINSLPGVTCDDLSTFPSLSLQLGDVSVTLPPESYIGEFWGVLPPEVARFANQVGLPTHFRGCELLMMTMDINTQFGPMWILGMPFFREYYTTFDLGSEHLGNAGRTMHVRRNDNDCSEDGSSDQILLQHQKHRVDLSKIQIPRWLKDASSQGLLQM